MSIDLANLPGADIVRAGVADLASGKQTEAALLVAMAAPRLRRLGLQVPTPIADDAGHRLYEVISQSQTHDPYRRYNSLIGRIVSFARALEHASAS